MASMSAKLRNWWQQRPNIMRLGLLFGKPSTSASTTLDATGPPVTTLVTADLPRSSSSAEVLKIPFVSDVYSEIFKLGTKKSNQEMKNLFLMAKEKEQLVIHSIVDRFVRDGNFDSALNVYNILWDVQALTSNPISTSESLECLNDFIEYLSSVNCVELCLYQFHRMIHQNSSCAPNTHTFVMIIYALMGKNNVDYLGMFYPRAVRVEECVKVFDLLFEHLKSDKSDNCDLDPNFYALALPFLLVANEPYKVSQLLKMIKDSNLSPVDIDSSSFSICSFKDIYHCTVRAFCYLWKFEEAAQFLDDHPYDDFSEYGYFLLLKAHCNVGRFDEANAFIEKLMNKGVKFNFFYWQILLKHLCQNDEMDKAFQYLKRLVFYWDQQHTCDCHDPTSPHSEICPTLFRIIMSQLHVCHSVGSDPSFSLAVYIMLISRVWKEDHLSDVNKVSDVTSHGSHTALSYATTGLHSPNGFPEKMIKKIREDIDSWALCVRGPCGDDKIVESFQSLQRMISMWYQEHNHLTTTDQSSPSDGGVPNSESYPSFSAVVTSSLSGSTSKGGDVFLSLAVYTMLTSGVWKDGHKCEMCPMGCNAEEQVPQLLDVSHESMCQGGNVITTN